MNFSVTKISLHFPNLKKTRVSNFHEKHILFLLQILPNGNDFELDVVFLINGEIYWVEGKTGNYQHYINKYSHVANMLNLDKNHSFLVLTDVINPNTTYILSKTFDMTIIPVEEFEEEIKYVFHENLIP